MENTVAQQGWQEGVELGRRYVSGYSEQARIKIVCRSTFRSALSSPEGSAVRSPVLSPWNENKNWLPAGSKGLRKGWLQQPLHVWT